MPTLFARTTGAFTSAALMLAVAVPTTAVKADPRYDRNDNWGRGRDRDDNHDRDGRRRKGDDTGAIVGAVVLGAGLLFLLSQSGKNKNRNSGQDVSRNGGDWSNPDYDRNASYGGLNLSADNARAVAACQEEVARDVRAKGGTSASLDELDNVSGRAPIRVAGTWTARFGGSVRTRTVTCLVEGDRVVDYRLS